MNDYIRLRVCDESGIVDHPWWRTFMSESGFYWEDNSIDYYLKPYNARNVPGEPFIEFETEEDIIAFKLKWCTK